MGLHVWERKTKSEISYTVHFELYSFIDWVTFPAFLCNIKVVTVLCLNSTFNQMKYYTASYGFIHPLIWI